MCEEITNVNGKDFQKNFKISGKPYIFDEDKNGFPAFTSINFERINFIIHHDSNYRPLKEDGSDSISETIKNRIRKDKNIEDYSCDYDDILKVVRVIDKLNSTRQSSLGPKIKWEKDQKSNQDKDELGRKITACYISTIENFYKRLEEGDPKLVDDIAKNAISPESTKKAIEAGKIEESGWNEEKINSVSRYTFSFASKYCTYMARAIFEKKNGEDGYCIFDKVMCDILPYYAWVYLGNKGNKDDKGEYIREKKRKTDIVGEQQPIPSSKIKSRIKDVFANKNDSKYEDYRNLIDDIIHAAECLYCREYPGKQCHITRKDFDHLLWYYFKGGNPEIERALKLVGKESALLR